MRKLALLFPLVFAAVTAYACGDMTPSGDMTAVYTPTNGGLTGGSNVGSASLSIRTDCSTGSGVAWNGTAWACAAIGGGVTNSAGNNVVPKSNGTNLIASSVTDDGTTWSIATNKVQVTEANGNTAIAGTLNAVGNITENSVRVFTVAGAGATSTGGTIDVVCTTNSLTCNANSIEIASRDFGDLTVGSTGTTMTIDNDVVTYAKMQNVSASNRIMGRVTPSPGDMEELTGTVATTLLDTFSTSTTTKGLVNGANGAGAAACLRGDNTWGACGSTYSAGTNLTLASTTFSVNPTITLAGASNTADIAATSAATGQTSSVNIIQAGNSSATFNTTSGALNSVAISGSSTSTRSAGANNLTNMGVYGNASGGQLNYSGYFDGGSFRVVGAAQFDSTLNTTGNLTENTVRVLTVAGNGLTSTGGTVDVVGTTGGGLTVAANSVGLLTSCGTNEILKWNGSAWACASDNGSEVAITATLSGNVNDWAPAGFTSATTNINVTSTSSGPFGITGISSSGRAAGSRLTITNTGGNTFVIVNETTSSTANQIMTISGVTRSLGNYSGFDLVWNGTKWVQVNEGTRYSAELYSVGDLTAAGTTSLLGNAFLYANNQLGDNTADTQTLWGINSIGYDGTNAALSVVASSMTTAIYGRIRDIGVAPSIGTCGTGSTILGGSFAFQINIGTGTPATCSFTFPVSYTAAPYCTVGTVNIASQPYFTILSATGGTLTSNTTSFANSQKINIICVGDA